MRTRRYNTRQQDKQDHEGGVHHTPVDSMRRSKRLGGAAADDHASPAVEEEAPATSSPRRSKRLADLTAVDEASPAAEEAVATPLTRKSRRSRAAADQPSPSEEEEVPATPVTRKSRRSRVAADQPSPSEEEEVLATPVTRKSRRLQGSAPEVEGLPLSSIKRKSASGKSSPISASKRGSSIAFDSGIEDADNELEDVSSDSEVVLREDPGSESDGDDSDKGHDVPSPSLPRAFKIPPDLARRVSLAMKRATVPATAYSDDDLDGETDSEQELDDDLLVDDSSSHSEDEIEKGDPIEAPEHEADDDLLVDDSSSHSEDEIEKGDPVEAPEHEADDDLLVEGSSLSEDDERRDLIEEGSDLDQDEIDLDDEEERRRISPRHHLTSGIRVGGGVAHNIVNEGNIYTHRINALQQRSLSSEDKIIETQKLAEEIVTHSGKLEENFINGKDVFSEFTVNGVVALRLRRTEAGDIIPEVTKEGKNIYSCYSISIPHYTKDEDGNLTQTADGAMDILQIGSHSGKLLAFASSGKQSGCIIDKDWLATKKVELAPTLAVSTKHTDSIAHRTRSQSREPRETSF